MIITGPTLERLARFSYKYAKFQEKVDERNRIDKTKEFLAKQSKTMDNKNRSKSVAPGQRLELEIKDSNNVQRNTAKSQFEPGGRRVNKKEEDKKEEDKKEEEPQTAAFTLDNFKLKAVLGDKKPRYKTKEVKTTMIVEGKVENFDIWVPLDATNSSSRVLSLSFNAPFVFRQVTDCDKKIEQESKIVTDFKLIRLTQDAKAEVKDLTIEMLNRHLKDPQEGEEKERLLYPSFIHVIMDKVALPKYHSDVTNIAVSIDPMELCVGFREIENIKEIAEIFQDLSTKMTYIPKDINDYDDYEDKERAQKARIILSEQKRAEGNANTPHRVAMRTRKFKEIVLMNISAN